MRRALAILLVATAAMAGPVPARQERPLMPAGAGPNRLVADVPLLVGARALRYDASGRYSGGLDDLRLLTGAGAEIPYLVVPPAEPHVEWRDSRVTPILATDDESGFEADLGEPELVDRLRLDGLSGPFLKRLRVEGSGDREHWILLVRDATVFDLPDEGLRRTEVTFAPETLRYVRVTWDDRASTRVGTPAASARLVDRTAPPEPGRVPITFERRPSEPGRSRFRLRLPGSGLPIRALELEAREPRLLRDARVTEPRLSGDEVVPRQLGNGRLRRAAQGELMATDLRIAIERPAEPELELVVDDGDNPPLELTAVSAELAPVPWVYFESDGGASLIARFGDPKLAAPRYDLEAARAAVVESTPPAARWGEVVVLAPEPEATTEPPGELPGIGAPIDAAGFRWARAIPDGPSGLTALVLDADVLARANGLADLRIVDPDGRQIPYVVERVDEPLTIALPPLRALPATDAATPRVSRYELTLPYESLPRGRLVLSTTARVFERQLTILVQRPPRDPRDAPRLVTVASVPWRHADLDHATPALVIDFPTLGTTTATITIDDGDNEALPIAAPTLLLPASRLRFLRGDARGLRLLYGAPGLAAPRYDLALLAPRILGATAHEVRLGADVAAEEPGRQEHPIVTQHRIFWVAIVAAVLALLFVLARLLRDDESPGARA